MKRALYTLIAVVIARAMFDVAIAPVLANTSIDAVNGGDGYLFKLRTLSAVNHLFDFAQAVAIGFLVFRCVVWFLNYLKDENGGPRGPHWGAAALLTLLLLPGCAPYDAPEYAEIGNQETGFLIKIEGAADQAKLPSEEFLASQRVADKRVQITHRWSQEGRMSGNGSWIPNVRLIKVDRTPVTRLWTKDTATGTTAKNEAVSVETRDSVNFSCGFSCTACIKEADAVRFLYNYPAGSLAAVMDSEVLGRIQRQVQDVANRYTADEIRARKGEILPSVERDLTAFYSPRGITITNVAMYGGLSFDNPAIQKAIDDAAIAQNLKVVEQGRLEAQAKTNERLVLEADGTAAKAKREAEGIGAAKLIAADAEANSIRKVNDALEAAKNNPLMLQFKSLEIQRVQAERWNGQLPPMLGGAVPFINMGAVNGKP